MDKYFVITFPKAGGGSIEYHNPEVPTQRIESTEETFFIFNRIAKILHEKTNFMTMQVSDIITKEGRVITMEDSN